MAYITKRGSSYSVRYTYQDEHGKSCDKWESFSTKEEAVKRQKQIEHELATGNFLIPSTVTVAEFLMDWLPKQCSKHKWAPKTYQSNLALIQNLIIPYIGEMQMQKLRPYHIEALYDTLSKTPCGQYVGGKRRDLSPKQQKRTLSGTTLHEVHQLLHNSFLLAVEWGILIKSPCPGGSPQKDHPRAQHLGGGGDASSAGQHGGPHPASGGAPDAGGCAAGRGGGRLTRRTSTLMPPTAWAPSPSTVPCSGCRRTRWHRWTRAASSASSRTSWRAARPPSS